MVPAGPVPPNKPAKRITLAVQEEFLHHLRNGMRRGAAAELLGFKRMRFMDFIEEHPDFEKAVIDAEGEANEHVEEALYQAAVSGNVSAARSWLELRALRAGAGNGLPATAGQMSSESLSGASDDDEELFPANVTRMDPRARRKKG